METPWAFVPIEGMFPASTLPVGAANGAVCAGAPVGAARGTSWANDGTAKHAAINSRNAATPLDNIMVRDLIPIPQNRIMPGAEENCSRKWADI